MLGPTGTGKTRLAYDLALRLGGEIVNCDAIQVYRGFDVATAKPTVEQRRRVRHHLVDCVDPATDFSLAAFVRAAESAVTEIDRRGGVPIVAGGTGMYLRGLLRGIVASPPRDRQLRERIHAIGLRRGAASLHRWLRKLDPVSATRLAPLDVQRVARAIEYALLSGRAWGEQLRQDGTWTGAAERYRSLKIGLTMNRRRLYERLDRRVLGFFEAGLVDEVGRLLAEGVPASANAFKAIGYREVLAAISDGVEPGSTLEQVQRSTRRYAKRQLTWFSREPGVRWLDAEMGNESLLREGLGAWHELHA